MASGLVGSCVKSPLTGKFFTIKQLANLSRSSPSQISRIQKIKGNIPLFKKCHLSVNVTPRHVLLKRIPLCYRFEELLCNSLLLLILVHI